MFFCSANIFEKKFKINHQNTCKAYWMAFFLKKLTPFCLAYKINYAFCSDKIKKRNWHKGHE